VEFPTLIDPWRPRSDRWLARPPSRYAGTPGRPLFIGACPRSGTTLLRSLLDNHPDLAIPPETDFVLPLWRTRVRFGDLRERKNRRLVGAWIFRTDGHGGRRIRARGLRDRMPTRKEAILRVRSAPPTMGSLIAACFELYAESHGKPRWGDKRPAYAGYVGAVFQLFPDAQFINVVRDPRGAVSSLVGLGWHRERAAVAASTATWEMSVGRVDAHARRLRPDQLLDVRYEDLVRDPHGTLARICEWAGLAAGDELIERMIGAERRGAFRPGWHDRLGEPIDVGPIAAWQDRLASHQVAFVERVAAPYLERFGYRPVTDDTVEVDPFEFVRLKRHRRRRRRKWRRERAYELRRRLLLYRRPVAAVRRPPG
jgi:hypothetical protein